ncbi:MAG: S8 family serine peptidase, partial [Methanobacteriota archaeon]
MGKENRKKIVSQGLVIALVVAMVLSAGAFVAWGTRTETNSEPLRAPSNTYYKGNRMIMLGQNAFDSRMGLTGVPETMKIASYDQRVKGYYLVQFNDVVDEMWVAQIKAAGGKVGAYVPVNAYMVKMSADTKAVVEAMPSVQYVGIYQPAFKIQGSLLNGAELKSGMICGDALNFINWENLYQQAKSLALGSDNVQVTIMLQDGENPHNVAAMIQKAGGKVLGVSESSNSVRAEVSHDGIRALAYVNNVQYVLPYFPSEVMLADTAWTEQTKVSGSTPVWTAGLHGEGVVVAVADTGLNTDHDHFRQTGYTPSDWTGSSPTHRKVLGYHQLGDNKVDYIGGNPSIGSGHGSHVTGIAVGNGAYVGSVAADRYGMAYEAKVSFCDIGMSDDGSTTNDRTLGGIPQDLKTMYALQKGDGASLASNSWGVSCTYDSDGDTNDDSRTFSEGTYSEDSLNSDWYMWTNKEFQIFFSNGNDREALLFGGPAYNTTTTPPATGKNVVSVGSHRAGANWQQTSVFSSYGATNDGRLKPDISATGDGLTDWSGMNSALADSTRDGVADTTYQLMQGTSMSSPATLGDSALISQYYREGWAITGTKVAGNGFVPSNAIIKATLINGAKDATTGTYTNVHPYSLNGHSMAYPNMDQGWGMVDTSDTLYFSGDAREVWSDDNKAGLIKGQEREYKVSVAAGTPLEITMVYTDFPGTTATSGHLVNDLDLTVVGPTGSIYYGNNYGATSRESDPTNPAGYDHLNPVECALITAPTAGVYTIRVYAQSVPKGPQPFALVIAANFDDGYGWVKTDKMVYKPGDTMTIEVQDTNAASASVTLTSSTGDIETKALALAATGRWTTTMAVNALTPVSGNGAISIEDDGTISVRYADASPAHNSYANVTTLMSSPKITNVRVTDISNTAGIVQWDTDVPATSQVFYGLTGALGSTSALDADMVLTHEVPITGLTGFTNYYFDVQSVSIGGVTTRDTNGGDHYMFTTIDNPDVLIIQEHSDIASSDQQVDDWRLSLGYYGWSFTVWETIKYGLPTLGAMNSAKVVYWDVGEGYPQFGLTERALIQSWLNQAGVQKFYATGQDIGWDMYNYAGSPPDPTWFQTYMHATFNGDSADNTGTTGNELATGGFHIVATTHAISTAFTGSPQDLEQDIYGTARFWPDDITRGTGAENPSGWAYSINAAGGNTGSIAYTGADYKLAYEAFAHAMIQDDGTFGTAGHIFGTDMDVDRAWIADSTIQWLMGEDHPDVSLTTPNGGQNWAGTQTISWTVANAVSQQVQISKDGGQSYVVEASGLAGTATSYPWNTARTAAGIPVYPNGESYRVKILAQGTTLKAFDTSDANFTVNNGVAGDKTGPVIVAGSIKVDPLPGGQGNTITFKAQADDRSKGNSNIAQAEYFIDATGANDAGVDFTADTGFNTPLEDVTGTYVANIAQGSHIVFVHARDAAGNWGGYEQFTFQINEGGPSVFVTAPNTPETVISGNYVITWTATDYTDAANTLDCTIEYSANGGSTWTVIESALNNNDGACTWNTASVADGVNYLVRVRVTDSYPLMGEDVSNYIFSVDNTIDDRWFMQVETVSGSYDLNMMPVELTPNVKSTASITAAGESLIGTWRTTSTYTGRNIGGSWTFNVYGSASKNLGDGVLYAIVKGSGGTTLDTTIYDTEDVFDFTSAPHLFTWTDTLAGTIPDGQGIIVELWVHVTSVPNAESLTTAGTTAAGGPHDVWFTVVDSNAGSELTTPNSATEFTDAYYTAASTSNDIRAGPSANPPVGDETFVKCSFVTAVNPAVISGISLTFEGSFTVAGTGTMYAWNAVASSWDAVGATTAFAANVEQTMTRAIASNWADYISGGVILWGVYNSGARGGSSVDYLNVAITYTPSGTVSAHFDYKDTQSNVQPYLSSPTSTVWQNITADHVGWNLVSVNISGPTTMPGALTDLANGGLGLVQWTRAMWYNPNSLTDPWKQYYTTWNSALNDLTAVDTKMGVWLYVTVVGDGQICVGGAGYSKPVSTAISLKAGWNLVGFPSDDAGYTVAMFKGDVSGTTVQSVEQYDGGQTYLTSAMIDANLMAPDK